VALVPWLGRTRRLVDPPSARSDHAPVSGAPKEPGTAGQSRASRRRAEPPAHASSSVCSTHRTPRDHRESKSPGRWPGLLLCPKIVLGGSAARRSRGPDRAHFNVRDGGPAGDNAAAGRPGRSRSPCLRRRRRGRDHRRHRLPASRGCP
jgi:hypothetical protein